jgi:hypothetical protein
MAVASFRGSRAAGQDYTLLRKIDAFRATRARVDIGALKGARGSGG